MHHMEHCGDGKLSFSRVSSIGSVCHEFHEIVILLYLLYWSIHTKDESKRRTEFHMVQTQTLEVWWPKDDKM